MDKTFETAVCAVYLYDAVLEYVERGRSLPWGDNTGGHLGFVDRLAGYAEQLYEFLAQDTTREHLGICIFHYEITPMLAEYMIDTKPWPTRSEFRAEAQRVFDLWIKEHEQC